MSATVGEVALAVLASGGGSIFDAIVRQGIDVGLLVVDRPCDALHIALGHDIPIELVVRPPAADFDRPRYTTALIDRLLTCGVDTVVMAGFMTVLASPLFDIFAGRVLNTHPSLLPAFPGAHAVRDALAFGAKITGCTIHLATAEVDRGPILAQEAVAVMPGDTEASLHERIKAVERRLYPETIKEFLA